MSTTGTARRNTGLITGAPDSPRAWGIWGEQVLDPWLLTLLGQALWGGWVGAFLYIPILQHLVVWGQAAEPQLVCAENKEEGRKE